MNAGSLGEAIRALSMAALAEIQFEHPWALVLTLLLVPLLVRWRVTMRAPQLLHARGEALRALPRAATTRLPLVVDAMLGGVLVLTILALAHPRVLGAPDPAEMEGIDIVVALDVSGSMRAADFKPKDRLSVAKTVIEENLLQRTRDRIGLVVFAGEAFTQAPLTHDTGLLKDLLSEVRTGVITDGTAIGDALATSLNRLRDSKAKSRVIILVTDGDNNAGNLAPDKAAELARELGIQIFPILVGKGGQVPYPQGTDFFGKTRYVYMTWPTNPDLLKRVASTTKGAFFSAENPSELAGSFQTILEELDRSLLTSGPLARRPIDLYPLVVVVALLLLAVAFSLSVGRASTVP